MQKTEGRSWKDFSIDQDLVDLCKNLRDGCINPKEVLKIQINFISDPGEIKKGNSRLRSEDQISVIQNVEIFFDSREKTIDFFRNYCFLLSEAKYKAKYERNLKILTTKQMLPRLPIALAQLKAGNISENLLNGTRQIIYSLYREKVQYKKVCKNIMNSIKL